MTILRNILAVLLGLAVGTGVNMALVVLGPSVIPPPAGVDVTDAQSLGDSVHLLEPEHFAFPFLAHALGTLAGALTAFLVAASYRAVLAHRSSSYNRLLRARPSPGSALLLGLGSISASAFITIPEPFTIP